MKKTIRQKFKYFLKKYLISLSNCFLLFLVASCSVQNKINKDDFKSIPEIFSASFYDKPDTIRYQYDNRVRIRSLLTDFTDTQIDYSKPVQIDIGKKELYLKFESLNKNKYVLKFHGKRYKRRFVFYTNYETISFPILFIKKEMTKYTVYMPDENEIFFSRHIVNEGMFLIIGAGNSSESEYKFKLLSNE